mgnify:CR=1 FL=1
MSNMFDVGIALIGSVQAVLLTYLTIRSKKNNKVFTGIRDTLNDQVAASLLSTQNSVQAVTQEVFRARQDHTVLAGKIDEVHVQVHELRGDMATLSERISQGTSSPVE